MKNFADALQSIAVTLWVGGMWAIGYIVAPVLFLHVSDRALAGALAGKLFALIAYVGIGCAAYLLLFRLVRFGGGAFRQGFFWLTLLMLALVVAGQFGVQPILESLREQALPKQVLESVFRDRFATWHGIASVLYLVQGLLGLALVLSQGRAIR
ncbi:MAG: DUF4149 domain-containing protein [Betaproteobacteria bacterium]|nr:DUF4149 domain-containing protein [Betaproteobacteria bacterium]